MTALPAAFSPLEAGRFTVRQRRGWAPWVLVGLSVGFLVFGVSLIGIIDGAAVLFLVVAALLTGAGRWHYNTEIVEQHFAAADFAEAVSIEVLGAEQPVLRVVWADRAPDFIDASAHTAEEARQLVAALISA